MSKKLFICLVVLFSSAIINAQDEEKIFVKVENEAHTNLKQWTDHIKMNTQLPDSVSKNIPAGTYKVNVQFIVDVHGSIGQIKAKDNPGYGLAEKAENILRAYNGQWKPASQCGRLVKAYRTQPIVFVVKD